MLLNRNYSYTHRGFLIVLNAHIMMIIFTLENKFCIGKLFQPHILKVTL